MLPTFLTFYTNDAYREDARRLERCCRHFGLPFEMVRGEERGGWRRNCNQKPELLERARQRLAGPLVWLDSDCVIHRRPSALLRRRDEDAMLWMAGVSQKHYVSSQVMWWGDTPVARAMITDWAERARGRPESLADPLLKEVCETWRGRAAVGRLPASYGKPYWKPVPGVRFDHIVISSNERRSAHPDATARQDRRRLCPLRLPYA